MNNTIRPDPATRLAIAGATLRAMRLPDEDGEEPDDPVARVVEAARALCAAEDALLGDYVVGDRLMSMAEAMGVQVEAQAEERVDDAWDVLRDALAALDEVAPT